MNEVEPTIGQVLSKIIGVPLAAISAEDAWEYIGGACVEGAHCPISRRNEPNPWERFVLPTAVSLRPTRVSRFEGESR